MAKKQIGEQKPDYTLMEDGSFVIENYNNKKPFSSFFPGIAGLNGIPIWAFYVNRGQGIAAFGVKDKNHSIMEFYPANTAYSLTSIFGFRTFIKAKTKAETFFYEPFKTVENENIRQRMIIKPHELCIEDYNAEIGVKTKVTYFTLPGEPLAALVRIAEFTNISKQGIELEIADGMPKLMPYWIDQWVQKCMSNTAQAWVTVENGAENLRFYRLKVEINDSPEVRELTKGNFFAGMYGSGEKLDKTSVIIDPKLIFNEDNSFSYPFGFFKEKPFKIPQKQFGENKYPSAFNYAQFGLKPQKKQEVYSVAGHIESLGLLEQYGAKLKEKKYFERKRNENKKLIDALTADIYTKSNISVFDIYAKQTYLDNVMRGGKSIIFNDGEKNSVFYAYSRKHGDLERDYNNFQLSPLYYSQGNGNFRDMNQNKRSDLFFNPQVCDFNVRHFYNLIQLDGYNPLQVKGQLFYFDTKTEKNKNILSDLFGTNAAKLDQFFAKPFEPGNLASEIEKYDPPAKLKTSEIVSKIICSSQSINEAEHGEGFWVDHWTYNLDLLENYIALYPEKSKEILFDKREFTFFNNSHIVQPRSKKYVEAEGKIRQFGSVIKDANKDSVIRSWDSDANIVRDKNGNIFKTNLITKLFCIALNKLASLDPEGIGIEMEAEKPAWYDPLNGLPGVFGSSVSETLELKRNLEFMRDRLKDLNTSDYNIYVPVEIYDFFKGLDDTLNQAEKISDFTFWDWTYSAKEYFRNRVNYNLDGYEKEIGIKWLLEFIEKALKKVEKGILKAIDQKTGLHNTYYSYEAVDYERTGESNAKGQPCVKIKAFKKHPLPLFLEGEVHLLKVLKTKQQAKENLELLKKSPLYDTNLQMFKVNASLKNEPMDIGRCTVFLPGWLENESIWLHMEYKYLLELLKKGLFKEFFEEFKKVGVCFQDPEKYGRSILENSSFIASSAFPDKNDWGRGFVARLSGSTAEFIQMWLLMTIGPKPFYLDEKGSLNMEFKPAVPKEYFTEEGKFEFMFLGKTKVCYHNSKKIDTYSSSFKIIKMDITWADGKKETVKGSIVTTGGALRLRNQEAKEIDIYF